MRNIKLIIEFDGTNFCGWQRQVKDRTVQGCLENAILKITGEKSLTNGSSRTDGGVHAKAMVANFITNSSIPGEKFREALNTKLPDDISIIKSEEVDMEFHARYSSKGKMYSYTIVNRYEKLAFGKQYLHHVRKELNVEDMKKACEYFLGKHDFKAFMSPGSSAKTTVRTITDFYIEENKNVIRIFISADGFLYNMVRIIVGTLINVGTGKTKLQDVNNIINDGIRKNAGMCVPPNGLVLEKVFY
ncbi:tRNA pseudouridine(38-40) synthase TruA [Clostridium botulinum]|uniref:tRNA pseudouridine synthase A n=2 Tax=Clostridium botulinum TaxID=1491 RepID=TRUA_CLOBA|nr:tRNA pseudouridine(38-40) synthase TruA [Clostridium botulinum]B2UYE4.1 RecName: Full=tRNA pseudouridine synthase A; AltName: Full=tRNA pseudouridine(38-40) synthase; AltName: Full=tRNA pseudouridylate synthase I; AltName: Full=tRNA-uridine isomerase I [Clostridium botulinum E3 str. Alaska E43]ACD54149.1 tRNA pseudouridine synthase A [Clostridium botulinum E3 str. Alaska E43]AJF28363.1 pseudouridine synthase [Clostridium botulinum]AJF31423.1 pseudouridine synthase [Clostridium botulinum]KAI